MHHQQPSWLDRLVWRRLVFISGWLSFFIGTEFLRISRDAITIPGWQPSVTGPQGMNSLFLVLLLWGLGWIVATLFALRALARRPDLRDRVAGYWWAEPTLVQIFVFFVPWNIAMFYITATGDAVRGTALGLLSWLHIMIMLLIGPVWVRRSYLPKD